MNSRKFLVWSVVLLWLTCTVVLVARVWTLGNVADRFSYQVGVGEVLAGFISGVLTFVATYHIWKGRDNPIMRWFGYVFTPTALGAPMFCGALTMTVGAVFVVGLACGSAILGVPTHRKKAFAWLNDKYAG